MKTAEILDDSEQQELADQLDKLAKQRRFGQLARVPKSSHVIGQWRCVRPLDQPKHMHWADTNAYTDVLVHATKRHPRTLRSENRRRNKAARASRKRNR